MNDRDSCKLPVQQEADGMRSYRVGYPQLHSNHYRHALRGIGEEQDHLPQGRSIRTGCLRGHNRTGDHRLCTEPFSIEDRRYLRFLATNH